MASRKIRVEGPEELLHNMQLNEATRATVGKFTSRRDPPHFQGDEYHAHSEIPGGYEVSWGISGSRRHENKFPAQVPADAKAAVAKVLRVNVDMLEGYRVYDENIEQEVLLVEVRAY